MSRRVLPLLVLCSAAAGFALGLRQIRATAAAYDEPVHLASGFVALTRGKLINGTDHPPFAEAFAALPLAALGTSSLLGNSHWGRLYNYADAFLYKNTVDAGRMLDTARAWSLAVWMLAFSAVCVAWAWSLGGPPAAVFAGLFCAAYPLIWSNAAVVGTDAASAALFCAVFFFLSRPRRGRREFALAGACAGLALASKFNMIALPGFIAAALLAEARVAPERRARAAELALLAVCAAASVAVVYRGDLAAYADGLARTMRRLGEGRPSFLAGQRSTEGWLWYFPLALALKTPLPLLGLAVGGGYHVLRNLTYGEPSKVPNKASFGVHGTIWILLPPAAYLAAACVSKTQIGIRHALPAAPFLCVLAGLAAARLAASGRLGKTTAAALLLIQMAGVAAAGPDGLTYFNALAGRDGGYRWLVDSNLDWGQGLKALAVELKERGNPPVYLSYFGVADPSYYGIRHCPLGWSSNVDRREGVVCPKPGEPVLLALSATNLQAVYFVDAGLYSWLDPSQAAARPDGGSILLFDLTNDAPRRQKLVELLRRAGAIIP